METHMSHENAQHMARGAQDVGKQTTGRKYAEARVDRLPERDAEMFMTYTCIKIVKTKRWQHKKLMW